MFSKSASQRLHALHSITRPTPLAALVVTGAVSVATAQPTITPLPIDQTTPATAATLLITDDGATAVGIVRVDNDGRGVRWRQTNGWAEEAFPAGIGTRPVFTGLSADGAVLVGHDQESLGVQRAWRWTQTTGVQPLFPAGTDAWTNDVSADGSTTVGWNNAESYGFTWQGGAVDQLPFASAYATAVSADGSRIYGDYFDTTAWMWAGGSPMSLGDPLPFGEGKIVNDCDRTQQVAVGYSYFWFPGPGDTSLPLRWDGQVEVPLPLATGYDSAVPNAMSSGASFIVGSAFNNAEPSISVPVIWTGGPVAEPLADFLSSEGIDLTSWTLQRVTDITPDGRFIAGTGTFQGVPVGFIAQRDACPADIDGVPGVDIFDLLFYLDLWFAMDPDAEWTGDDPANVDIFDLLAYLDNWFAGC